MATLPLIPFPEQKIREKLTAKDCRACMESWLLTLTNYLCLPNEDFEKLLANCRPVSEFLLSYVRENALAGGLGILDNDTLRGLSFRMIHRSLLSSHIPPSLLSFHFLSDLCLVYCRSKQLNAYLERLWLTRNLGCSPQFLKHRTFIQESRGLVNMADLSKELTLKRITALLFFVPNYGRFLVSGSGFLDWLIDVWSLSLSNEKSKLMDITFLALKSDITIEKEDLSFLLDHLYSLKAKAHQKDQKHTLSFLQQLCTRTPLISVLQKYTQECKCNRAESILSYMQSLRGEDDSLKLSDGKGKRAENLANFSEPTQGLHFRSMDAITRVQEIFPDVSAGFISKLLDEFFDDVETVIAHLLENSPPNCLAGLESSETISVPQVDTKAKIPLRFHSIPPFIQRKAYDADEFDQLITSPQKIHIGKKDHDKHDEIIIDKVKIFSSLAAFDLDDDERDDTYDFQDVGGSVDTKGSNKDWEELDDEDDMKVMYSAWKENPSIFNRNRTARQSLARQALRSETNMTDEAIEGFAHVLLRDKKKLAAMEKKFSEFTGEQERLDSNRWNTSNNGQDYAEHEGLRDRDDGQAGRERKYQSRGRGAAVSGLTHKRETQMIRQKKDENKSAWANHGRKAERARKLGRAGLPN